MLLEPCGTVRMCSQLWSREIWLRCLLCVIGFPWQLAPHIYRPRKNCTVMFSPIDDYAGQEPRPANRIYLHK
jgi:hypothetical protein